MLMCKFFLILMLAQAISCEISNRIINGRKAKLGQIKYQIELRQKHGGICGGSLYTSSVIITAAHCFDINFDVASFEVRAGTIHPKNGGQTRNVCELSIHPKYDFDDKYSYDLAVIRTCEPFELDENIGTIKIAEHVPLPYTIAQVSGFGLTDSKLQTFAAHLILTTLYIASEDLCVKHFGDKITSTMICAVGLHGEDACQGDSGGPLVVKNELVGLVSWGPTECGKPGWPGVYTNIVIMKDFIEEFAKN